MAGRTIVLWIYNFDSVVKYFPSDISRPDSHVPLSTSSATSKVCQYTWQTKQNKKEDMEADS